MGIQLGNFNEAQQRRQLLNYYESRRERIFSERNWFQKNTGVCLNVKKTKIIFIFTDYFITVVITLPFSRILYSHYLIDSAENINSFIQFYAFIF